jgi:endonuclease V-like protein UPF0215 family
MTPMAMRSKAPRIREIKPEIRVLGIDDAPFTPHSKEMVDIVGVVFRGGYYLDGFMHTKVQVDGMDATEKIADMITTSPHHRQLRVAMLNGVTMAGFNVVDIKDLHERVKLPIVAVTRDRPDFEDIQKALQHLPEAEKRWNSVKRAGKMITVRTREGEAPIYVHATGIAEEDVRRILRATSTRSNIPEALRVAHIIASGLIGNDSIS